MLCRSSRGNRPERDGRSGLRFEDVTTKSGKGPRHCPDHEKRIGRVIRPE